MGNGREGVRERALARMRVLAGGTAAGVVAACGYGVVDPLPPPTCFESPQPTATGQVIPAPSGQAADGVVFVEIIVRYASGVTARSASANEDTSTTASGPTLAIVSSDDTPDGGHRLVVRVPTRVRAFNVTLTGSCDRAQNSQLTINAALDADAGQTVTIYSVYGH